MIARAVVCAAQSGVTLARRSHSKEVAMPNLDGEILQMDTTKPGSEEQLLKYAEHEDELVRASALEMLWDFVSQPVIERMAETLGDDTEDQLVVVAALDWVVATAQLMAERWTLDGWTYWMDPEFREWLWMEVEAEEGGTIRTMIDRLGDPSLGPPPGFLWLFAAAGDIDFDEARQRGDRPVCMPHTKTPRKPGTRCRVFLCLTGKIKISTQEKPE
jgi:hypothetical protein